MGRVGKIVETGRASFEWQIPNFFRWARRGDGRYQRTVPNYPRSSRDTRSWASPTIGFCNDTWDMVLYVDKSARCRLEFWAHVPEGDDRYDYREDDDTYRTVRYAFAIRDADGRAVLGVDCEQDFTPRGRPVLSFADFWPLSWLEARKSTLVPGNIFTIVATFEGPETRVSLPHRYLRVPGRRKSPPTRGSDFVLKSGGREWPVHKRILAGCSDYFRSMFGHGGWTENSKGWVRLDDIQQDVMDWVLEFVYRGAIEDLDLERVWDLYAAADKLLLAELKAECVGAIEEELGPDVVWGALALADRHGEKGLRKKALKYLVSRDVWHACRTGWESFRHDHPAVAEEVLEEVDRQRMEPKKPEMEFFSSLNF